MNQPSVVSDIDAAVRAHADGDAVETAGGAISYRRFGTLIDDVADQLAARTAPGYFVGIDAHRTAGSIVAMVGALKAGRPFLFLDPRDSASNAEKVDLLGITVTVGAAQPLDRPTLTEVTSGRGDGRRGPAVLPPATGPDRLGYAIYTSGSTGEPKCVLVRADPLRRLARDHVERLELDPSSRTLQFARLTFDGCITEILWTLTSGACLVVLPEEQLGPGPVLQATLEKYRITHLKTTPFALTATGPTGAMSLQHVVNGGGACRRSVARTWAPVTSFHNAYGLTETTVCSLLTGALDPDDCVDSVPLGTQVGEGGFRIEPRPADGGPAGDPDPSRGELVVTGDCVALGHLTRDGLQRFVDDDGSRVYRTGDVVERRGGEIHYVERLDQQLKVRGYRLDPGEVETAACRLDGVVEAVVTAESHAATDSPGSDALVCYFVGDAGPRDVRAHLEAVLDPYKVPSVIRQIDAMPYTRNGKVDRGSLRAGRRDAAPAVPAASVAQQVLDVVGRLTGTDDLRLADNFYEVGGDSASTVLLVQTLKQLGWMDAGVRDVLRAEDLGALVARIPDQGG